MHIEFHKYLVELEVVVFDQLLILEDIADKHDLEEWLVSKS